MNIPDLTHDGECWSTPACVNTVTGHPWVVLAADNAEGRSLADAALRDAAERGVARFLTRWDEPMPWPGSPEAEAANRASHNYQSLYDSDVRCVGCDCRPSYVSAGWPCGTAVPRLITYR